MELFEGLQWVDHGGFGYPGLTREALLDMDWDEIVWLSERLRERQREVVAALRRGTARGA